MRNGIPQCPKCSEPLEEAHAELDFTGEDGDTAGQVCPSCDSLVRLTCIVTKEYEVEIVEAAA